ncbi:MAG: 6-carboxytetrahydropterin synthase QueD [Candidatus Omnitrophica bacterium]|nr:6-carboxytetrahydropterin synthase QueD [Candidatus Omnitrophota bacterium]
MYKIKVISDFSAAHMLRGYKGKCENMHGHNWRVEVSVYSDKLNGLGMVADFTELKKELNAVLEGLDHKNLNDLAYFKKSNPTSENIAKYIYDRVNGQWSMVKAVTVWESDRSSATYTE